MYFHHCPSAEENIEDQSLQNSVSINFSDLSYPHESKKIQRSLKFLKATTEESARVIEDPLESPVEMGVDVAMLNKNTGGELMAKHIGRAELVGGVRLVSAPTELDIGGQGSAFSHFKPISGFSLETDEQKLSKESTDRLHPLYKPTPAPRILLNERELQLSPSSPPFGLLEQPALLGINNSAN